MRLYNIARPVGFGWERDVVGKAVMSRFDGVDSAEEYQRGAVGWGENEGDVAGEGHLDDFSFDLVLWSEEGLDTVLDQNSEIILDATFRDLEARMPNIWWYGEGEGEVEFGERRGSIQVRRIFGCPYGTFFLEKKAGATASNIVSADWIN